MGSKKKILVCGSASFVMSNLIRYLLYRSQDYSIVSVDNLEKLNDIKRIYFHKNHKFYIGDISNKYFMDRIIFVEKPDFIIFGDEIFEFEKILTTTLNLIEYKIPTFFIQPAVADIDKSGFCCSVSNILKSRGGKVILMPNKFGMRQRASLENRFGGNVAQIMKSILDKKRIYVTTQKVPWVYGEDIASFIWYLFENKPNSLNHMPQLGFLSEKEIAEKIANMYETNCDIIEVEGRSYDQFLVADYFIYDYHEWKPDSSNIESALDKTIRWFDANRWAFNE